MEVINRVSPSGKDNVTEELHKLFNEQGYSDYVVVIFQFFFVKGY